MRPGSASWQMHRAPSLRLTTWGRQGPIHPGQGPEWRGGEQLLAVPAAGCCCHSFCAGVVCGSRARLPVSSVSRTSQMWFCFSPIFSTGESCEQSLPPVVLMCQEKGACIPGCTSQVSACHGRQQGWVFLFHPAALLHVVGTKAVSGPILGRLLCPSATVMFPLCYLASPTTCTYEAALVPGSSPCWEPLALSQLLPSSSSPSSWQPTSCCPLTSPSLTLQTPSRFPPLTQPAWLHEHFSVSKKFSKPRAFWKG